MACKFYRSYVSTCGFWNFFDDPVALRLRIILNRESGRLSRHTNLLDESRVSHARTRPVSVSPRWFTCSKSSTLESCLFSISLSLVWKKEREKGHTRGKEIELGLAMLSGVDYSCLGKTIGPAAARGKKRISVAARCVFANSREHIPPLTRVSNFANRRMRRSPFYGTERKSFRLGR